MNASEFISSGLIETFCLGFTSEEENELVASMAAEYPEVAVEISSVRALLQKAIIQEELKPKPSVKQHVMQRVYEQQATIQPEFIPLLNKAVDVVRLDEVIKANPIPPALADDESFQVFELPSTREVTNLAAWVRHCQEEEVHENFNEYIAVVQGACTMYFDGEPSHYERGEIITIPPNVTHHAIITSATPMLALVQRQML